MDTHIELIEKDIGSVAEIEENTYTWRMPSVMSRNFSRLMQYASGDEQMPYARYVGFDWKKELSKGFLANAISMLFRKWHFFTGVQTPEKREVHAHIRFRHIDKRRYVKAVHYGPYHKLGSTYQKMFDWSNEHNIVLDNESLEFYLNDPRVVGREKTETMVLIPVVETV